MSHEVHLVAVGARTPVGLTAASSAAAVHAGIARLREHAFMVDACGEKVKCGCDAVLDPKTPITDRMVALARHALLELVAPLTEHASLSPRRVLTLLALPELRPGFALADARAVEHELAATRLPGIDGVVVERTGEGHAGALHALMVAAHHVVQRRHDLCFVGGVDSYLDADTLDWLDADQRMSRGNIRSGFPPGEGATMLAVASNSARLTLGLPSLARIRGVVCTRERRDRLSDEGMLGEALTDAISRAAAPLGTPRRLVDDVYCDINGERDRTDDWGFALLRTSTLFRDGTEYTMSVSQCGDMGAGTAAFNCALATQAWQRGYARGPVALVWGSSWAGLRGAVVLERGDY